jgi:hypothetical protein
MISYVRIATFAFTRTSIATWIYLMATRVLYTMWGEISSKKDKHRREQERDAKVVNSWPYVALPKHSRRHLKSITQAV